MSLLRINIFIIGEYFEGVVVFMGVHMFVPIRLLGYHVKEQVESNG